MKDEFIMVDEFRASLERSILQFSSGKVEQNESPYEAAKRELREETGYEPSCLKSLGSFYQK